MTYRANGAQIASGGRQENKFGHVASGLSRRTAFDAIAFVLLAGLARRFGRRQELRQIRSENECRSLIRQCGQSSFDPPPHRPFGDAERPGGFFDRIVSVNLDALTVWLAAARHGHKRPGCEGPFVRKAPIMAHPAAKAPASLRAI